MHRFAFTSGVRSLDDCSGVQLVDDRQSVDWSDRAVVIDIVKQAGWWITGGDWTGAVGIVGVEIVNDGEGVDRRDDAVVIDVDGMNDIVPGVGAGLRRG